jgi:hypothetical protein
VPNSSTSDPPHGRGRSTPSGRPWRVLLLLPSADDPVWALAVIVEAPDVRPAVLEHGRYLDWAEVTAWAETRVGHRPTLQPIDGAKVWTVQQRRRKP